MSEVLLDLPGMGTTQKVVNRWRSIDKRFALVDMRFEEINRRIDLFTKWSFGTSLPLPGVVIAAIRLL